MSQRPPLRLSRRSAALTTPNALTAAWIARAQTGQPTLDLTVSNPTDVALPTPRAAFAALAAACAAPDAHRYAPDPFGHPAARAAAAALTDAPPERVLLTASTSEAYGFLFKALCDSGDAVLVPQPSYPLFEHLTRLDGVHARPYAVRWESGWRIDPQSLAADARTRAIVVVHPNNPVGNFVRATELNALLALGLPVISDEVFADFAHRHPDAADPWPPTLFSPTAPVIALGGLSKCAGLPQLKCGWITVGGPDAFARPLLDRLELIADTYLSVAAPVQRALPVLLAGRAEYTAALRARLAANRAHLAATLPGTAVCDRTGDGGWTAVLRLPHTRTDEAWALAALDAGVRVQPGYFYDFADDAHLVLSLLPPPDVFAEGLTRLLAVVHR